MPGLLTISPAGARVRPVQPRSHSSAAPVAPCSCPAFGQRSAAAQRMRSGVRSTVAAAGSSSEPANEAGRAPDKPAGQGAGSKPLTRLLPKPASLVAVPTAIFLCCGLLARQPAAYAALLAALVPAAQLLWAAAMQLIAKGDEKYVQDLCRQQPPADVMAGQAVEWYVMLSCCAALACVFVGACMVCSFLAAGLHLLGIPDWAKPVLSMAVQAALYFCLASGGVLVYHLLQAWRARRLFWAATAERRRANAARRAAQRSRAQQSGMP
ncbi:hypothetical protein ABPG75_005793 [Micractinium tetrahymenae]